MKLWKPWSRTQRSASETRAISRSSSTPGVSAEARRAGEVEATLTDALARLAEATSAASVAVDTAAARRRLEARLAAEASLRASSAGVRSSRSEGRRRPGFHPALPLRRSPSLAVALTAAACLVLLLGRGYLTRPSPAPKLEQVRFDSSLWELDRIADTPLGSATADMTDWPGR